MPIAFFFFSCVYLGRNARTAVQLVVAVLSSKHGARLSHNTLLDFPSTCTHSVQDLEHGIWARIVSDSPSPQTLCILLRSLYSYGGLSEQFSVYAVLGGRSTGHENSTCRCYAVKRSLSWSPRSNIARTERYVCSRLQYFTRGRSYH